jgi:hypothetical protein
MHLTRIGEITSSLPSFMVHYNMDQMPHLKSDETEKIIKQTKKQRSNCEDIPRGVQLSVSKVITFIYTILWRERLLCGSVGLYDGGILQFETNCYVTSVFEVSSVTTLGTIWCQ